MPKSQFQKKLALYTKAMKHAWTHIGLRRTDQDINDYNDLQADKSRTIYRNTKNTPGGWGTQLGRRS